MKTTKPFRGIITESDRNNARELAQSAGGPYGFFFSTSGKLLMEPINPNAQYAYIWRTDRDSIRIRGNGSH